MTAKCKFCNDTKQEPGVPGVCVWCEAPKASAVRRYTAVELRFATNSTGDYVSAADYDALAENLAERHQGKPVAWRGINDLGEVVTDWIDGTPPESMVDLCGNPAGFASIEQAYTHADAGEVERPSQIALSLQAKLKSVESERDRLRAEVEQLRIALADIAERHAPVERDERAEFEAYYVDWFNRKYSPSEPLTIESMVSARRGDNYGTGSLGRNGKWEGWQARAALERKP